MTECLSSEPPPVISLATASNGLQDPMGVNTKDYGNHSVYTLHNTFLYERKYSVYIQHDILKFTFTVFPAQKTTPHTHLTQHDTLNLNLLVYDLLLLVRTRVFVSLSLSLPLSSSQSSSLSPWGD